MFDKPTKKNLKSLKKVLTFNLLHSIIIHVDGRIAQLVEHLPYKQEVIGSSPIAITNYYFELYSCLVW